MDIRFTGDRVVVPAQLRAKIYEHWQNLQQRNPKLHNGEVFTVQTIQEDAEMIHIRLAETDYAHYLYSRQIGDLGEHAVRIIHPAALVIAGDEMIFGSMGSHTSLAGLIQCCGGGIDHAAVEDDGTVAIDKTIAAELKEELGIDKCDRRVKSLTPAYLKVGGLTCQMTLIYILELEQTSQQFLDDYATFVNELRAKNEESEFEELFCISTDAKKVEAFIQQHESKLSEYMPILLRTVSKTVM